MMVPKDNTCAACGEPVDPQVQHYIVWSPREQAWKRVHAKEYKTYTNPRLYRVA